MHSQACRSSEKHGHVADQYKDRNRDILNWKVVFSRPLYLVHFAQSRATLFDLICTKHSDYLT